MIMTSEEARTLGRIEGKLDMLIDRLDVLDDKHYALQKRVWWSGGAAAVIGVVAGKLGLPWPTA